MIPLNLNESQMAFHDKKINMYELTFITNVRSQDDLAEKQYNKLLVVGKKMLPYKLLSVNDEHDVIY
jgi:hypothetical protein